MTNADPAGSAFLKASILSGSVRKRAEWIPSIDIEWDDDFMDCNGMGGYDVLGVCWKVFVKLDRDK